MDHRHAADHRLPSALTAFTDFGHHRLRSPAGIIIDTPIPIAGGWVGTLWPTGDADPDGPAWSRHLWEANTHSGRGWLIPDRLAAADIVEFGSDPTGAHRWYGIVHSYDAGLWLTIEGPYESPAEANRAAQAILAPHLHSAIGQPPTADRRLSRSRCHTRRTPHRRPMPPFGFPG